MESTVSAGWSKDAGQVEPPPWELPGLVPFERVVTRSEQVVISVGQVRVLSTGIQVTFEVRLANGLHEDPHYTEGLYELLTTRGRSEAHDRPVLGAGTLDTLVDKQPGQPSGLRLDMRSGGGRGPIWHFTYWLSPAPAQDLTLHAAWPDHGVPAGEVTIMGQDLRDAYHVVQRL
jgi:hypothetical protein